MYQFNNLTSDVPNVQTFNASSFVQNLFTIGQFALGGRIAYIFRPGDPGYDPNYQKGLVVTASDLNIAIRWWNGTGIDIGTSTAFGTGLSNTNAIIAAQGAVQTSYAAGLARAHTGGGFTDWYLPSLNDLGAMAPNFATLGMSNIYWSSSQLSTNFALVNGGAGYTKDTTFGVRAVRTFTIPLSQFKTWTKPNDAMMIHILCIGGGAGGGSGRFDSGGTRFGGGGGGSAAVTSMFVPAFLIPDTLYVQVGVGGGGGAAQTVNATDGNAGTAGGTSYVGFYPDSALRGNLLLSANGGSGGAGGSAASGTGGAGGTALTVGGSSPFYLGLGQFTSTAGQAGGSADQFTTPSVTISGITCGGAPGSSLQSGGGTNNGGSIISPSSLIPYLTSISGTTSGTSDKANSGYAVKKPLMFVGGTGSRLNPFGPNGPGGDGSTGSGGGGGGAGYNQAGNTRSGAGGNGGDGLVIITAYSI
jgi:hypothetical protein